MLRERLMRNDREFELMTLFVADVPVQRERDGEEGCSDIGND